MATSTILFRLLVRTNTITLLLTKFQCFIVKPIYGERDEVDLAAIRLLVMSKVVVWRVTQMSA